MSQAFIDTLDPVYDRDIHAAHRRARERGWLARTPHGLIALDYEGVHWLLRDPRWREFGADALAAAGIADGPLWEWFHQILSNKEGEDHARLRRLVSQAFTPRRVERLRPAMRATAQEFLDAFTRDGHCEFVEAFAAPYPVRVIGALLGVPPGDFARFHAWSRDLSLAFSAHLAGELPRIEAALGNLSDYVDGLLAARRRTPQDDLISALLAAEEQGDRLDADELRAMVTVLIFGGQDTTQCQLACAAAAAEEVLRYEPAGSGSPRLALEDIQHRGVEIAKGTVVLPSGPAANRDPGVYPDPDRFDIRRKHAQPMLTFGGGVHYCLGASLARAELQEALPLLAQRMPGLALDGEASWRSGSLIRGPERLPVRFERSG